MKNVVNKKVLGNNDWEKLIENSEFTLISPSLILSKNKILKLHFCIKQKIALDKKCQLQFLNSKKGRIKNCPKKCCHSIMPIPT